MFPRKFIPPAGVECLGFFLCAMGNFCLDTTKGMSRNWMVWPILWAILAEKVDEDDDRPADSEFFLQFEAHVFFVDT
jgi:hypothetical protein